jgi:hypothetical protein
MPEISMLISSQVKSRQVRRTMPEISMLISSQVKSRQGRRTMPEISMSMTEKRRSPVLTGSISPYPIDVTVIALQSGATVGVGMRGERVERA